MSFKKDVKDAEKQIMQEIKYAEKWMVARRKFVVKLLWVVGFIGFLLILSHLYLRATGVGI